MITGIKSANETKPYILLEGFYKDDIWNLLDHPQFETLSEKQKDYIRRRKHKVSFSAIKSKDLSNEIKYYCQHSIEDKNRLITTFQGDIGAIELTTRFLNERVKGISSITEVEIEKINLLFDRFLLDNGYSINTQANNAVSEDMEYMSFSFPTIYKRFFLRFTEFINDITKPKSAEKNFFVRDKWNIKDLPFRVDGFDPSRPRYLISFEKISQENIKYLTKKYTLERLKSKKYSTCIDNLKGINILSEFLEKYYPQVDSLNQLNRDIIEDFLGYINLDENLKPRTKSSRIGSVKTFFETCMLYKWNGAPEKTLILTDDVKKKYKPLPRFYEDNVLLQINSNLEHLPIQIARMVYVIQNVGMRISELCNLKSDCLKRDTEDDYLLEYYQEKTKEWNRVPIVEDIAITIKEAIDYSQKEFNNDVRYVFAQDQTKPISKDTFAYHLNQLSKIREIRDKDGKLVRIKSHHFRGTIATKYANLGLSSNVIRMLLGQRSVGAIKHYIEILEETMTDSMKSLLSYQDVMINNIGKDTPTARITAEDSAEVPLPNGKCTKPISAGKCTHANACYLCAMFKPDPKNIDMFKYQLFETKSNIKMAKLNGFERVLQYNEELASSLETIISTIEDGGV